MWLTFQTIKDMDESVDTKLEDQDTLVLSGNIRHCLAAVFHSLNGLKIMPVQPHTFINNAQA